MFQIDAQPELNNKGVAISKQCVENYFRSTSQY